jgi:arylsulfatase
MIGRKKKTNQKIRSICLATLFAAFSTIFACQKQKTLVDLKDEAFLSRGSGRVFAIDFLQPESEGFLEHGWSKWREDNSRMGAFPDSWVFFSFYENAPLYLTLTCKPLKVDDLIVRSIGISLNGKELTRLDLAEDMSRFFTVTLPEKNLKRGENILEFLYIPEKRQEGIEVGQKRKLVVHYSDFFLTSEADFSLAKVVAEATKRLSLEHPGSFVQKVPSDIDFYLRIPQGAFLDASFEWHGLESSFPSPEEAELKITCQKYEGEETLVHRSFLGANQSDVNFRTDVLPAEGPARLRVRAGNPDSESPLQGFIIWKSASIGWSGKRTEDRTMEKRLKSLKEYLNTKSAIIVIMDAARVDRFSFFGHSRPTTPNIDRIAEDSTVFSKAFCDSITTRTSIGTLFTGFPLSVHSMIAINSRIPEEFATLAQCFQSRNIKTTGFTGVASVSSDFGFGRGFDQYFELYKEEGFGRKSQEYLPYLFPWLEANKERNFFLYIHFKEPHAIYIPQKPFRGMFSSSYREKVDIGNLRLREIGHELSDEQVEYVRACYDENLASVDSVVGKFVNHMRELGMLEKTILILTSDHGEFLGEHDRIFGHGGYFGESGIHIPLIIRFPESDRFKIPRKINQLVKNSDLFATLADIYGFDVSQGLIPGKSLLPLLVDPQHELDPYVIIEKFGTLGYCCRTLQHKLNYWDSLPFEFYDLQNDPEEKNNIFSESDIMANYLLTEIRRWIAKQAAIKETIIGKGPGKSSIDYDKIDKRTLDNLRDLGYIK